jgi:hypothetical protein
VRSVFPGSECESAGVKAGMVLKRLNGLDVGILQEDQILEVLENTRPLTIRLKK